MRNFSKSLNHKNIDKSVSDIRIRFRFPFESSFWISVSGCKLTILPDIQPANQIVIISVVLYISMETGKYHKITKIRTKIAEITIRSLK